MCSRASWCTGSSLGGFCRADCGGAARSSKGQFLIFNSQFLTLIKAGLPILNSLDLLIKRQRDPYLQSLLQNVRDRVKAGELLSDAFSGQGAFPKIYTSTLMAGEKSGNMEEVLSRYIAFQRMALTFKKKLAVSLVYPTLLVTVGHDDAGVPGHLRGAAVRQALSGYGCAAAGDHADHVEYREPCAKIFSDVWDCRGRGLVLGFWQWKKTDRGAERIDRAILALPCSARYG